MGNSLCCLQCKYYCCLCLEPCDDSPYPICYSVHYEKKIKELKKEEEIEGIKRRSEMEKIKELQRRGRDKENEAELKTGVIVNLKDMYFYSN
ncbi:hypothetical protein FACS189472_06890 [Alphaproteobacteria bacterium]|nr:hypothetical protein FACS189472_06890 [Alphaproteobacteria bacterium]